MVCRPSWTDDWDARHRIRLIPARVQYYTGTVRYRTPLSLERENHRLNHTVKGSKQSKLRSEPTPATTIPTVSADILHPYLQLLHNSISKYNNVTHIF
jgi:hypothetical protein